MRDENIYLALVVILAPLSIAAIGGQQHVPDGGAAV